MRQAIHEALDAGIGAALDEAQRRILDALLVRAGGARLNPFLARRGTGVRDGAGRRWTPRKDAGYGEAQRAD
jgi:hypothetical protein